MQQLVHNNSGASMGTLETALSEHKDAEDKAMSKHEQMRLRAKVKKLARQEKWKQKAAKEARKIVEMKGKQMKGELSLAMIQLFTKLLDEDSVEASTIDDAIR